MMINWVKDLFVNTDVRERRRNALQQIQEGYSNAEQARLAIQMMISSKKIDDYSKEDTLDFLTDMDNCLCRIQHNTATAAIFITSNSNDELVEAMKNLL